jgi:hypothetical protein
MIVWVDASIGIEGTVAILSGIEESGGDRVVFADDLHAAWPVLKMIEAGEAVRRDVEAWQVIGRQALDRHTTVAEMVRDYRRAAHLATLRAGNDAP